VVFAVVVSPLVDTVVVALVLPDFVVTVLVDGVLLVVASAGLAMSPKAATEAIKAFIFGFLQIAGKKASAVAQ
jgi:hypothetical protein